MRCLLIIGFIAAVCIGAEKPHQWEKGKVLSQQIGAQEAGTYAAPLGTASVAVPIYRHSNAVTIDTGSFRYQWIEAGRSFIVLPVNAEIEFYRDGNWFIVLDSRNKKHKFSMVGAEAKPKPEAAK